MFFKDVLVGPDRSWTVELLRDLVKTLQFDEKNIENRVQVKYASTDSAEKTTDLRATTLNCT